jgi:hypothetical protein
MNKKIEENKIKNIISRRQMLATSFGAVAGTALILPATKSVASTSLIIPYTESLIALPGGWGFLKRMFDFKNWFWRGVGAFLREALNVQQYPQITPYNQNQSNNGWQVSQSPQIFEIPNQNFNYSLTNSYPTGYQEVVASNLNGQQNIFGIPPAGLIAMASFLNALRCQCQGLSTENLQGLMVPRQVISQVLPRDLSDSYYGKYQTGYGSLELTQTPGRNSQSDLFVRVNNEWGPKNISKVITPDNPMQVSYSVNGVNTI